MAFFSSQDGSSMNFVSEYWRTVQVCMKGVQLCPEATQSQLCLRSAEFVYFWSAEFVYFWSAGFVCIVFCCLMPDKQVFSLSMSAVWSMAIPYLSFSSFDQNVSAQCASSAGFEPSLLCFNEEVFVVIVGRWRTTATEKLSLLHGFTWYKSRIICGYFLLGKHQSGSLIMSVRCWSHLSVFHLSHHLSLFHWSSFQEWLWYHAFGTASCWWIWDYPIVLTLTLHSFDPQTPQFWPSHCAVSTPKLHSFDPHTPQFWPPNSAVLTSTLCNFDPPKRKGEKISGKVI